MFAVEKSLSLRPLSLSFTCFFRFLRSRAVDLHDLAHLGDIDELVDEALAVDLGQDAALVVIPKRKYGLY